MKLPKLMDTFIRLEDGSYFAEYDGWHFEGKSPRAVVNQILRYIWGELK